MQDFGCRIIINAILSFLIWPTVYSCQSLNSANSPGGGYRSGSGAQEESLCRRSDLWQRLENSFPSGIDVPLDIRQKIKYPLPEFGGAYCRKRDTN